MSRLAVDNLTLQRIRVSTRAKLVALAKADRRSPVSELDWIVDEACRAKGIDPDAIGPKRRKGGQNDAADEVRRARTHRGRLASRSRGVPKSVQHG